MGDTAWLLTASVIVIFAFCGSYALYWLINKMKPMRVSEQEENLGLDLSQHGEHI